MSTVDKISSARSSSLTLAVSADCRAVYGDAKIILKSWVRIATTLVLLPTLLTACIPQHGKLREESVPAAAIQSAVPSGAFDSFDHQNKKAAASPACRLENCCAGRGDVAYMQADWFVICADGLPSDVCDCHYVPPQAETRDSDRKR